jgi:hypothetical protein
VTHESLPNFDDADRLDRQLNQLPQKYRLPVILCVLQGLSKREAAAELGVNEGTLASRLARGRELLRTGNICRNAPVGLAALLGLTTADSLMARVTMSTQVTVTEACVSFTIGVPSAISPQVLLLTQVGWHSMIASSFKWFGGSLVAAALAGASVVGLAADQPPREQPKPVAQDPAKPKPVAEKPKEGDKPRDPAKPNEGDKPKVGDKPKEGDKPKDPAKPQDADKPGTKRVIGVLGEANETARAITLVVKADTGDQRTIYKLDAASKVFVDGKEVKLGALPANARIEVAYTNSKEGEAIASEIRTLGKERRLRVSKIEGDMLYYQTEGADRSFPLAKVVEVQIGKALGKLADVKMGDGVTVTFSADEMTIVRIWIKR